MPTWFKMLLSVLTVLVIGAIGHAMQEPIVKDNLARKILIEEPVKKQPRLVQQEPKSKLLRSLFGSPQTRPRRRQRTEVEQMAEEDLMGTYCFEIGWFSYHRFNKCSYSDIIANDPN